MARGDQPYLHPTYDPLIQQAAAEAGVDPNLLRAVLWQESRFAPDVVSGKRRSSAGAIGIAQFLPDTATAMGVTDPTDPKQAIPGAARYLRQGLDEGRAAGVASPEAYAAGYYFAGPDLSRWGPKTRAYMQNAAATAQQFSQLGAPSGAAAPAPAAPGGAPGGPPGGPSGTPAGAPGGAPGAAPDLTARRQQYDAAVERFRQGPDRRVPPESFESWQARNFPPNVAPRGNASDYSTAPEGLPGVAAPPAGAAPPEKPPGDLGLSPDIAELGRLGPWRPGDGFSGSSVPRATGNPPNAPSSDTMAADLNRLSALGPVAGGVPAPGRAADWARAGAPPSMAVLPPAAFAGAPGVSPEEAELYRRVSTPEGYMAALRRLAAMGGGEGGWGDGGP